MCSLVTKGLLVYTALLCFAVAACSKHGGKSGASDPKPSPTTVSDAQRLQVDLTPADIKALRSRMSCDQKTHANYCAALERFVKGSAPSPSAMAIYSGSSLFVNLARSPGKTKEEASYLILMKNRAMYDKVIPENDEERRQVGTFLSYFQRGKLPPTSDPIVKFCKTLKTLKTKGTTSTKRAGRSLKYERTIRKRIPNQVYIREAGDTLVVVELRGSGAKTPVVFVGVFPKATEVKPAQ